LLKSDEKPGSPGFLFLRHHGLMKALKSCDLFCRVVDNYGDIGIASRLARQLHEEQGLHVRLWVDDLHTFRSLHAAISIERQSQVWLGIEVRHWGDMLPEVLPHDLVIEAFACELPDSFLKAMAVREPKPVWLNLEYLSAEFWVDECHGLPSPHPQLPLTKYFFFPGYTVATGGLLRENALLRDIQDFQNDIRARSDFWNSLSVPVPATEEIRVSLFAYENPAIPSLLEGMARHVAPVTCLLPAGKALGPAQKYLGSETAQEGDCFERGSLILRVLPFLSQLQYDRLLWACDVNVVRGEDSFIRAQFAGRPVLWQAYVQEGDAHEVKVQAWLDKYLEGVSAPLSADIEKLFLAWNRGEPLSPGWLAGLLAGNTHARSWADHLAGLPSLSDQLVKFARTKL
jgi:uncharacterized repeat protein (TIGR03837 family)